MSRSGQKCMSCNECHPTILHIQTQENQRKPQNHIKESADSDAVVSLASGRHTKAGRVLLIEPEYV